MKEIFGYQEGTHRFMGLVDSESSDEFDDKLVALLLVWNNREKKIRQSNDPIFFKWFQQYQSEIIKSCMLKPVRVRMGLGKIPKEYTNNANESANARIKEKVNYKRSELHEFCKKMKELIDKQRREIERAFTMDTGSYKVAEKYSGKQHDPKSWTKRSIKYKERFIRQIHKLPLEPPCSLIPSGAMANDVVVGPKQLSVSWEDIGLSEDLFSGMWLKAAKLAADPSSISDAPGPGLSTSKMVASSSNPRKPHLVTCFKNGKITCDCVNNSTKSLCAHALAVAERQGVIQQLVYQNQPRCKPLEFGTIHRSAETSR